MSHIALRTVQLLLAPERLSYIQEIVFLGSWEGKRYRQIATESGYDYDYIKEVGFQLWQSLSQKLDRKVTKKNVRVLLAELEASTAPISPSQLKSSLPSSLEFPGGPLAPDSPVYAERLPFEAIAYREILKPGGLVRIKAPQQSGKTSLVLRLIAHAETHGLVPVILNLQSADQRLFHNLNDFLRWLCIHMSRQLNLEPQLDEYWDEESGSKLSCNAYLQLFLLEQIETGVLLIFDEITPLFDYPELAQDVLPLFRIWHESASQSKIWQKLRLVVVHNVEMCVPLKLEQSPFNVGLPIELTELNLEQTQTLAQQCLLNPIEPDTLENLVQLVGGNPYLLQLAFYWLNQKLSIEQLMAEAPTEIGIYGNDLKRQRNRLQQNPSLLEIFKQILWNADATNIETIGTYKLESLGLIHRNGNHWAVRCKLYRDFFTTQL